MITIMDETKKCPRCCNNPFVRRVVTRTEVHDKVSCCEMEAGSIVSWNKYVEAMKAQAELNELKDAVRWERECLGLWDYEPSLSVRACEELVWSLIAAHKAVEELL